MSEQLKDISLARFLAYRLVDRDSFTVNGELNGKGHEDYYAVVDEYETIIKKGLTTYLDGSGLQLLKVIEGLKTMLRVSESESEGSNTLS